jgi:hypothetical protein
MHRVSVLKVSEVGIGEMDGVIDGLNEKGLED